MSGNIKKFTIGSDVEVVNKKDILNTGDWLLKWDPNAPDNESGFALFTPGNFDPSKNNGPVGGLVLAAVYFILEHGEQSFARELIARANELSKELELSDKEEERQEKRTLN